FEAGYIRWDDENIRNSTKYTGQPSKTVMYEPRTTHIPTRVLLAEWDGHATNAIILPTDSPFVMLKSNHSYLSDGQRMKVRSEYFH
ncbi:hypothetical protein OS493_033261, partial [Desmophyllum pertusum]